MQNKVVLADDHQFLLDGISGILKEIPSVQIVATVQNGYLLMEAIEKHLPQLAILDLNMPGYDGLQCLQKIKANYPATRVLVLTNYSQPELVEQAKKMNADGFMIKNCSAAELRGAIMNILLGKKYYPPADELKSLPEDSHFFDDFLKKYKLTKREIDIIRMIGREKSTKTIASELFLSELTINTHRRNILRKLEVRNVAGLINFAKETGLL